MSVKSDIFEKTLKSAFDIGQFVAFSKEFFNNLTIIRPDKIMEDSWNWSEFNFHVTGYYHIANFNGSDNSKIAVFAVRMKNYSSIDKARSVQRNFIKKLIIAGALDAAIVAFYSVEESKWRLSFIKIDYEFAKGKTIEKLTPAKRYSYLVGEGEPCHTAMERLFPIFINEKTNPTISDIEEAFSVEKVTKDFFEKYKEKYLQLKDHLDANEDFISEANRLNFSSEQFTKKLMGQLAFLYFIQKKGWLGVNAFPKQLSANEFKKAFFRLGKASREVLPKVYRQISEDEYLRIGSSIEQLSIEDQEIVAASVTGQPWGTGPKNFIRELYKICIKNGHNFFDDYLEPLFYEALNEKRGANDYYAKLKCRVPFLNGGLFEALDSYDWNRNNFEIPNEIFSNINEKGEEKSDGILDIFDRYNFTMNEDEPLEKEVAVDPEMLGKIFENLLDVKDRKSKGAFYTPREIVHYMCQESLVNYLSYETGISYNAIKELVVYGEFFKDEDTNYRVRKGYEDTVISKEIFDLKNNVNKLYEIDNALVRIRVADPAVGSGAFPLGMLSEIVKIRQIITEYIAMTINDKRRIQLLYDSERHPLQLKLQTIKNSIFGVDIDPSAVDITKLRLWLSLVVEQETNENAEDEGILAITRNPRPLPNLDCNIKCGNSLIDEFEGIQFVNESELLQNLSGQISINLNQTHYDSLLSQLFDAQDKLFYEKSHVRKEELKKKIDIIYDNIIRLNLVDASTTVIKNYELLRKEHSLPFFYGNLSLLEFSKKMVDLISCLAIHRMFNYKKMGVN